MSARRCASIFLRIGALTLVSGCFSDLGTRVTNPGGSEPVGSSGEAMDGTSTGAAPTSTAEPVFTTGGASSETSGVEDSSGGVGCPADAVCQPGEVMNTGELCDPCGRVVQVCGEDCVWGVGECVQDPSSCAYWTFGPDDKAWERVALPQPAPEHAPTAPVLAAFDLRPEDRIVVLTADRFHVLAGASREWVDSGALEKLLPGLPGQFLHTYAIYEELNKAYTITVVGDPLAWLYTLPAGTLAATYVTEAGCCESFNDFVMPPSVAAVRDLYIDLEAPYPWTFGQFFGECIEGAFDLSRNAVWVTPTDVYVQDAMYCFEMVYTRPLAEFTPFAAPGAPPGERVGGVTLLGERLFVFAGE